MYVVFDLDGTICFKGQPVSNNILDALVDLTKKGHHVIFASARPIRDMLPVIREDFQHYTMIGGNGALISKQKKLIHTTAFSTETIKEIKRLMDTFEATYLIDSEWDYAYTGSDNHPILQKLDPGNFAEMVALSELPTIVKILILTSRDNEQLARQ